MQATLETLQKPVTWARQQMGSLPCNVGRTEQKVRIVAGSVMIAAAFAAPLPSRWRTLLGVFGAMELATGAVRYCPVSHALGINTCRLGDL
ncbi:DUF2892 domain-containing protein [Opitutus sp. ER46]|uniref:YgaP family membrane protein n=1 Tax=Opitutus sp. ER46 TaxID=2161864 RepID=UPI000D3125FD|nr:DUF2892 domain-containing protein [Opitutus sp. ER46]PTX92351.1 DUF2892 domain-containing protein [Opitutus sp. ER46]